MIEMLPTEEQRQAARDLMMSPAISRLCEMAQGFPFDMRDQDGIKSALCTASLDLIRAPDGQRIHFERDEDHAMFYGLLVTAMQIIFDGKLGETAQRMRVQ